VDGTARVECALGLFGPETAFDLIMASTIHPDMVALAAGLYGLDDDTNR